MADICFGSFIWNEEKDRINRDRHGVSFAEATAAFADPDLLIIPDVGHSLREERFFGLGRTDRGVLTVRFTYRSHLIRIIGAGYWRKTGRIYWDEQRRRHLH